MTLQFMFFTVSHVQSCFSTDTPYFSENSVLPYPRTGFLYNQGWRAQPKCFGCPEIWYFVNVTVTLQRSSHDSMVHL